MTSNEILSSGSPPANEIQEQLVHSSTAFQAPSLEDRKTFFDSMRKTQTTSEGLDLLPALEVKDAQPGTPAYYDSFKTESREPALSYIETGSNILMMAAAGKGLLKGAKVALAAAALKNVASANEKVSDGKLNSSDVARESTMDTIEDSAKIGVAIGVGKAGKFLAGTIAAGITEGAAVSTAIDGKTALPIAAKLAGSSFEGIANGLSTQAIDGKDVPHDYGQMAVPMLVDVAIPGSNQADERIARKLFGTILKKVANKETADASHSGAEGITDRSLSTQLDVYKLL